MYIKWYELATKAMGYEVIGKPAIKEFKDIIITGMGGSGIVGDVIYSLLYTRSRTPITVVKDFRMPGWVSKDSLVCVISYSGNTLETLSAALDAMNAGAEVCVVASGGKLLEFAISKGLTYVKVDQGLAPRAAFPLLLIATLKALEFYGINVHGNLERSLNVLKYTSEVDSVAKELAFFIFNSLPVILSSCRLYPIAMRFKNELNENSKIMAKVEVIPEWGHNDIVGWELPLDVIRAVVVYDGDPLMEFVARFLRDLKVPTYVFNLEGDDLLSKILYGVYVAGLASIYLAELRKVDPVVTRSIDRYKEFLNSRISINA